MEAIRALQKKLAAAQAASNSKRISERNCIDVVQKLIDTKLVKLIHTAAGKEWLTPEQLDREILDVLAVKGGRVSISELPGEIGAAIEHCESRVELLLKQDASLMRLHGEILSSQCVQTLAEEISESLEQAGCIAISDIAIQQGLPVEFVRDSVLSKLGKSCTVKPSSVYTSTHSARVEARVRGALRGSSRPVVLSQLAQRHQMDTDMVATAAQKLVKDGAVLGKVQGGIFTPKVHRDAEDSKFEAFFNTNQYMPFQMARSAGINLKEWVQARQIAGLHLNTIFISNHLCEPLLASVSESLSSVGWVDVQALLPPTCVEDDARELLRAFSSQKKLPIDIVVFEKAIVSNDFVKRLASDEYFATEIEAAAKRLLNAPAAKGGAAKKSAAADDEDEGGSKKKGKKTATKGKKAKADDSEVAEASGSSLGFDPAVFVDFFADNHPDLPYEMQEDLCGLLQPQLAGRVEAALEQLRASLQSGKRVEFDKMEKMVQENYEKLVVGLHALEMTKLLDTPLVNHLMRETVVEPLHKLLAFRMEEATGNTTEVNATTRKQVLDKLTAKEGAAKTESLSKLLQVALGKSKEEKSGKDGAKSASAEAGGILSVPELFHAAADDCHIYCRKVDKKKREKVICQERRAEHRDKLQKVDPSDAAAMLYHGLQVLLACNGVPGLMFPSDAWAFQLISKSLAAQTQERDFGELIAQLCSMLEEPSPTQDPKPPVNEETTEAFRAKVLEVKA